MNYTSSDYYDYGQESHEYEFEMKKQEWSENLLPFLEEYGITSDNFHKCYVEINDWVLNEGVFRNLKDVLHILDWANHFESKIDSQRSNSHNWLSGLEIKIEDFRQRIERGHCASAYKAAINGTLNQRIPESFTINYADTPSTRAYSFAEILIGIGIAQMLRKLELEYEILKNGENVKLGRGLAQDSPLPTSQFSQINTDITDTTVDFRPMVFKGSARLLAQCMKTFQTMNLCPQEADMWVWAAKAFVRSNGLPFKNLAQALDGGSNAKSGKPNGSDEFDNAISAAIESDKSPISSDR